MIQEHIHSLLFEHDCVIIPDFGGLITHYEPARIHPVKHSFLPPSKRIAFNEKLKLNDGLLISTFAYSKYLTSEEAQRQVAAFVQDLKTELQASQRYELRGIGIFRLNAERKIEFDYVPGDNFLNDAFGLPELIARPVLATDVAAGLRTLLKEKQSEGVVTTAKPSLRKKVRRLYDISAVFAVTGLTASALYFISLQKDYSLSSLNPFALFNNTSELKKEPPAAGEIDFSQPIVIAEEPVSAEPEATTPEPAKTASSAQPVAAPETPALLPAELKELEAERAKSRKAKAGKLATVTPAPTATQLVSAPVVTNEADEETAANSTTVGEASSRYYIIAAGFSTLKKAESVRQQLANAGNPSKVILPFADSKLHRITLADYASREEAVQQLPRLKKKHGKYIWILNY